MFLLLWFLFQQKYKELFEKSKGKMIGLKTLQDDLNIAHSVHASTLQSDVSDSELCFICWNQPYLLTLYWGLLSF